jgi:hypothetical protein
VRVSIPTLFLAVALQSATNAASPPPPTEVVPQDGSGLLVAGSAVTTLGAGLVSTGVASIIMGETVGDSPIVIPTVTLIFGGGFTTLGGVFLNAGVKHRRRFRAWEAAQGVEAPPRGNAMIAGGVALMIASVPTTAVGGAVWSANSFGGPPPEGVALVATGITMFASSYLLLGLGLRRHKRFGAWQAMLPTASASPHGFSLGLAGRF